MPPEIVATTAGCGGVLLRGAPHATTIAAQIILITQIYNRLDAM